MQGLPHSGIQCVSHVKGKHRVCLFNIAQGESDSIVENDTEKGAVNLQFVTCVVVDKAQFSEPVHEKAYPRASCTNHFGQCLLADLRKYCLGYALFAKMGKQ